MANNTPEKEAREQLTQISSLADEAKQSLQQKTSELQKSLEQKAQELKGKMDKILEILQAKQSEHQTVLEKQGEEIKQIVTGIESNRDNAENLQKNLQQTLEKANQERQTISQARAEIEKVKTDVETQLENSKNAQQQSQGQAEISTKHAAEIKAKLESAIQSLASIEEQKSNILAFYKEIENHKAKMLDIEKEATGKFNQLREKSDAEITDLKQRTEEIITENESLQHQIQEHLARAVSVSLFKAFGHRQKWLVWSRLIWLGVLIAALGLAFLLVQYIVKNVSAGTDTAFFIRLSLAGPVIFLMYFAASQYKKDRQAEEEYAFKSAISISLEPYRDLLKKMREDNAAETEFVKQLIEEVFDNPARHIYQRTKEKDEESVLEGTPVYAIEQYLKKITGDTINKKQILDFIANLVGR